MGLYTVYACWTWIYDIILNLSLLYSPPPTPPPFHSKSNRFCLCSTRYARWSVFVKLFLLSRMAEKMGNTCRLEQWCHLSNFLEFLPYLGEINAFLTIGGRRSEGRGGGDQLRWRQFSNPIETWSQLVLKKTFFSRAFNSPSFPVQTRPLFCFIAGNEISPLLSQQCFLLAPMLDNSTCVLLLYVEQPCEVKNGI